MERGIKNWMLLSVAIVLVEVGSFGGARWGWHTFEWTLDGVAAMVVIVAVIRWFIEKLKK